MKFTEGRKYQAYDPSLSPITVVKRTEKTILVTNEFGYTWRMKVRTDSFGNEYAYDSRETDKWRTAWTFLAMYEI